MMILYETDTRTTGKNVDFALKCLDFVLTMFDFVLKMLDSAGKISAL